MFPVSIPAASVYATLLVALCFVGAKAPERLRRLAWSLVTLLAMMAGGAATWFIFLQFFVLHGLCLYCMAVHTIGLVILTIVLLSRPIPTRWALRFSGVAMAGISVLIAGQLLVEPPPSFEIETYADDTPTDSTENEELFILGPVDDTDVMELVLPEETVPQEDSSDTSQSDAQTVENPNTGSSKVNRTSDTVTSSPERSEIDLISNKKSTHAPQPSLTPVPGEETDSSDLKAEGKPAEEKETEEKEAEKKPAGEKKAVATPKRLLTVLGGRARLDIKGRPIVGSPDAKYILVELFDYTCKHCRELHGHLEVACKRYGDQLAVLTLVVPLNTRCNSAIRNTSYEHRNACDLARCALAVWRHKPDEFAAYHAWLFAPYNGRSPADARAKAAALVGQKTLNKELNGSVLDEYLKQHAGLYLRAGKGPIPKLMCDKFTLSGQVYSADSLCRQLEQHLDLKRQDR